MATLTNITLDEAVQKAQSTKGTLYIWFVCENVLDREIPQGHSFGKTFVIWNIYNRRCIAGVELPSAKEGVLDTVQLLKEDNCPFDNQDELRQAYPKLFEVTGNFRILTR